MRMVRPLSAMARVIPCLIHQVAYVENLYPLEWSNFSAALISPRLPSWMRSRNETPRLRYFLAIETTSLRLDSTRRSLDLLHPLAIPLASLISSAWVRRGTLPISARYILMESPVATAWAIWTVGGSETWTAAATVVRLPPFSDASPSTIVISSSSSAAYNSSTSAAERSPSCKRLATSSVLRNP